MLLLAGDDLPQIAQNSQKLLLGMTSHRFHRSTQKLLLGITSHRFHRFAQIVWVRKILPQISQIYTEAANFRGCTCLKCTNQANKGSPTDCTEFTEPSAGETSHRFHRFTQMVRLRKILPQIAQIYTEVRLPSGGKTRKQYALKGQKHIAQGNALGKYAPH